MILNFGTIILNSKKTNKNSDELLRKQMETRMIFEFRLGIVYKKIKTSQYKIK